MMEIQKKRLETQIRKLNNEINETGKKCENFKEKELEWNAIKKKLEKEKDNEINIRLKFEDAIKDMQSKNEMLHNDLKKAKTVVPEE